VATPAPQPMPHGLKKVSVSLEKLAEMRRSPSPQTSGRVGFRSSTPLNISGEDEGTLTPKVISISSVDNAFKNSTPDLSQVGDISHKREASDEGRPIAHAKRRPGRPPDNPAHLGKFTAEKMKERAFIREEEKAEEAARGVCDPVLRATCKRSLDARRSAEEMGHELKLAPTADIAARAHEEVEVLLKVAQLSKNLQGGLRKDIWEAAATLMAANQALSLRA